MLVHLCASAGSTVHDRDTTELRIHEVESKDSPAWSIDFILSCKRVNWLLVFVFHTCRKKCVEKVLEEGTFLTPTGSPKSQEHLRFLTYTTKWTANNQEMFLSYQIRETSQVWGSPLAHPSFHGPLSHSLVHPSIRLVFNTACTHSWNWIWNNECAGSLGGMSEETCQQKTDQHKTKQTNTPPFKKNKKVSHIFYLITFGGRKY